MNKPYNTRDHTHCLPKDSPCGIEGEHRCCLCERPARPSRPSGYDEDGDVDEKMDVEIATSTLKKITSIFAGLNKKL